MNKKTVVSLVVIIVLVAGIAAAGFYFLLLPQFTQNKVVTTLSDTLYGWKFPVAKFPSTGSGLLAYADIRDPGGIPEGLPVRLKIPVIGVDSAIEDAQITPDGRMDVPAGSKNVAWFSLGPHPGQEGSAVIGGHFGITNGVPFVFYNLDKIKINDKVYIVDDRGDTIAFIVRSIRSFDRDADATTVFTSDDGLAHLNLITCEGIWNKVNDTYPQRLVVFTDAVPAESAVTVTTQTIFDFRRSLSIGARGADVTALQTILEKKGFLTMPSGIAKGFFGTLTRTAVTKYQTSVGLSPVGIFGPLTRAKLASEQSLAVVKPTLPSTAIIIPEAAIVTPEPSTTPQPLIQSIKSLFETPLDRLIISLLLMAIIFVAFKIFRR